MIKWHVFLFFIAFLAKRSYAQPVERQSASNSISDNEVYFAFEVDRSEHTLEFFWQDDGGHPLLNFDNLSELIKDRGGKLAFAMNGGMYNASNAPMGLFIEKGKELQSINKVKEAYGNFYMQPNGVFYLTDSLAIVSSTESFSANQEITFATQSGPMLLVDSAYHPAFNQNSESLHIRNGVGILPNGNPVFIISKSKVNFYTFASFFRDLGCRNALYLDGFVSRVYAPRNGYSSGKERFGVMIGVY